MLERCLLIPKKLAMPGARWARWFLKEWGWSFLSRNSDYQPCWHASNARTHPKPDWRFKGARSFAAQFRSAVEKLLPVEWWWTSLFPFRLNCGSVWMDFDQRLLAPFRRGKMWLGGGVDWNIILLWWLLRSHSDIAHRNRIHVWYISLHLVHFYGEYRW